MNTTHCLHLAEHSRFEAIFIRIAPLVDNQELEQLTARLSAFSLFNVLRVDHIEIRHSNVRACSLTPS